MAQFKKLFKPLKELRRLNKIKYLKEKKKLNKKFNYSQRNRLFKQIALKLKYQFIHSLGHVVKKCSIWMFLWYE